MAASSYRLIVGIWAWRMDQEFTPDQVNYEEVKNELNEHLQNEEDEEMTEASKEEMAMINGLYDEYKENKLPDDYFEMKKEHVIECNMQTQNGPSYQVFF